MFQNKFFLYIFLSGFTYLLVFLILLSNESRHWFCQRYKLKIMTLISTSMIPLNLFMEIILSLT
jgi:hypothetical protein